MIRDLDLVEFLATERIVRLINAGHEGVDV
jgi:hypothetical protein